MWHKDFIRHLWVPAIPAGLAFTGLAIKVLGLGVNRFSPADLFLAICISTVLLALPLLAFLLGMQLFQQENWALVGTLPRTYGRVALEKLAVGGVLCLLGAAAGWIVIVAGGIPARLDVHLMAIVAWSLIGLAIPLLAGVFVGLATTRMLPGVLLTLALGVIGFLVSQWVMPADGSGFKVSQSGFPRLSMPFALDLGLLLILLPLGIACLVRSARMFRPLRNAGIAAGLGVVAVAIMGLGNVMLTHDTATLTSPGQLEWAWIRLAGERHLAVTGSSSSPPWLASFGQTLGVEPLRSSLAGLYDWKGSRISCQFPRSSAGSYLSLPDDGRFLLRLIYVSQADGYGWQVRDLWDVMTGRQVTLPGALSGIPRLRQWAFWRPGSHRVCLVDERTLTEYDLDTHRSFSTPLPGDGENQSPTWPDGDLGCLYLDEQTLLCIHRFGDAGFRVYRYRTPERDWVREIEVNTTEQNHSSRARGWFWTHDGSFSFQGRRVVLARQGERIVHCLENLDYTLVLGTQWGVLRYQDRQLVLRDWETGANRWALELNDDTLHGFAWGDRALLVVNRDRPGERKRTRMFVLRIPEGKLEPLALPVPEPSTGWINDARGPIGLLSFSGPGQPEAFYRLDLRDRRLTKVLELSR